MATLTVTGQNQYSGGTLVNIDSIVFSGAAFAVASVSSNQFGPGHISNSVALTGDGNAEIQVAVEGTFSAAGWTFSNWTPGFDFVQIDGSAGIADTITGSSQNDSIFARGAGSTVHAGAGNDLIGFDPGQIGSGEILDGGKGFDTIKLYQPANYDLSVAAISSIESLEMQEAGVTAIFRASQIGAGKIDHVTTDAINQAIVVNGPNADLSGLTFSNWGAAGDTITINGTAAANTLSGSSQGDTLNGFDSDDTLLGNGGNDVLRGGSGDDTLNGGNGLDKLIGGAGSDHLNGGADNDTFIYSALTDSGTTVTTRDQIIGFALGDKIDVHLIDAIAGGADNAFVLDTGGAFVAGEIHQTVTAGGDLRLDFNVDADATPEMSILLVNHTTLLTSGDFIL